MCSIIDYTNESPVIKCSSDKVIDNRTFYKLIKNLIIKTYDEKVNVVNVINDADANNFSDKTYHENGLYMLVSNEEVKLYRMINIPKLDFWLMTTEEKSTYIGNWKLYHHSFDSDLCDSLSLALALSETETETEPEDSSDNVEIYSTSEEEGEREVEREVENAEEDDEDKLLTKNKYKPFIEQFEEKLDEFYSNIFNSPSPK